MRGQRDSIEKRTENRTGDQRKGESNVKREKGTGGGRRYQAAVDYADLKPPAHVRTCCDALFSCTVSLAMKSRVWSKINETLVL